MAGLTLVNTKFMDTVPKPQKEVFISKSYMKSLFRKFARRPWVKRGVLCAVIGSATVAPCRAILIDNTWNLTGSNQLATDFVNFPSFAAAGQVGITEGAAGFNGTGVLIAPDWVLTAAHNWNNASVTALTFTIGGTLYNANLAERFQHPLWNSAPSPLANASVGISQGWDIALFRLTTAVTGITPAQIYTGTNELNSQVYTLGFGRTGTGTTAVTNNVSGAIHGISNTVDRTTSQTSGGFTGGQLFYDFDSGAAPANSLSTAGLPDAGANSFSTVMAPAGTIAGTTSGTAQVVRNSLTIEGGTAQGDSGGPTYVLDGGAWKVAGVTSWGVNPADNYGANGLYGDVTAVTRVSAHTSWINGIVAVPEPSAAVLLIGALLPFMFKRKRLATRVPTVC